MVLLLSAGGSATRQLPLGDAERGRGVFRSHGCVRCHSVNREGGSVAPDLARMAEPGFTPSRMAARLWNHAPAMWRTQARQGLPRPELTSQQAADLFAYFFAMRYCEAPGDVRRGKHVFREKRCAQCHGLEAPVREGIQPARKWVSLNHPMVLAQQFWNHSGAMRTTLERTGTPYPFLTPQDLSDMLAYLRSALDRLEGPSFMPGSPEEGKALFSAKGCAACHRGDLALEGRPTRYTLTDFAAAMWNHARSGRQPLPRISVEEIRRIAGYLLSVQFLEERGNPEHGKVLFTRKHCAECHEKSSGPAPNRSAMAGRMTSFGMIAAVWKHGPAMREAMQRRSIRWPQFEDADMADLTAYLHGYEFKRRQPAGPRNQN